MGYDAEYEETNEGLHDIHTQLKNINQISKWIFLTNLEPFENQLIEIQDELDEIYDTFLHNNFTVTLNENYINPRVEKNKTQKLERG